MYSYLFYFRWMKRCPAPNQASGASFPKGVKLSTVTVFRRGWPDSQNMQFPSGDTAFFESRFNLSQKLRTINLTWGAVRTTHGGGVPECGGVVGKVGPRVPCGGAAGASRGHQSAPRDRRRWSAPPWCYYCFFCFLIIVGFCGAGRGNFE